MSTWSENRSLSWWTLGNNQCPNHPLYSAPLASVFQVLPGSLNLWQLVSYNQDSK
jgi:hypothetical protein